ncbi:MAG: 1-acyl-sn-glycerol-3-phosphate acyltransferase [Myxococcales bacterium]|nr:1-acyl-sn-glycerol-3-phosphate acyltransferase [Myxococcales bacterium]
MSTDLPPPWDAPPRLRDHVVSAALWTAGVSWLVPVMGAMMASNLVLPPDRTEWLSRLYCRGQVRMTGARWRSVVDPAVDPQRTYLFASNHVNLLDHVTMYDATPHFKQGLELESHFKIPVYGWFMRQRGTIPVKRRKDGGQQDELREHFRRELDLGHSILAFPEGTRTRDGRVGPFRKGVFFMARDLGLPVVPVSVTGMYEILRAGSGRMRRGRQVTVYCDAPLDPTGLSDEEIDGFAERVRGVIAGRVDAHLDALGRSG